MSDSQSKLSIFSNPKYWELKAEEARTVADVMTSETARKTMLKIAEGYENLATIAKSKK